MIHISSHFMPFRSFQWSFLIFSSVLYTKWDSFFTFFSLFSLLSSFLHSFLPSLPPFHLSFFLSFFFPFLSFTETYVIFIGSPIANSIQVKTATKRKLCSNMNIFFFTLRAVCSFGILWTQRKRQCVYQHQICNRLPDYNVIPRVWRSE